MGVRKETKTGWKGKRSCRVSGGRDRALAVGGSGARKERAAEEKEDV